MPTQPEVRITNLDEHRLLIIELEPGMVVLNPGEHHDLHICGSGSERIYLRPALAAKQLKPDQPDPEDPETLTTDQAIERARRHADRINNNKGEHQPC